MKPGKIFLVSRHVQYEGSNVIQAYYSRQKAEQVVSLYNKEEDDPDCWWDYEEMEIGDA